MTKMDRRGGTIKSRATVRAIEGRNPRKIMSIMPRKVNYFLLFHKFLKDECGGRVFLFFFLVSLFFFFLFFLGARNLRIDVRRKDNGRNELVFFF